MGKTPANKRLVIVAYPPVSHWPELADLEAKGHTVIRTAYPQAIEEKPDLVVGEVCWRLTEELRKYLPLAIKNARSRKVTK